MRIKTKVESQSDAAAAKLRTKRRWNLRGALISFWGSAGSIRREQRKFLLAAFAPVIVLFIVIRVIPIASVLLLSFTNFSLRRPVTKFIGLDNFARLLDDPQFALAFSNSIEFLVISVPAVVILGLLLALFVNRKVRLEGLYQTLYFLPYILSTVPTSIIWKWIYAPGRYGLANYILESVGLGHVGWLTDRSIALLAIIGMYVWKNLGYYVVIFLVGLKNIPSELREAAEVDGSSAWQSNLHIDIPLLKPVILFGTIIATIDAMSVFTIVYVMSQGTDVSAGIDIAVLATRIYQEGFVYFDMGYASSICLILFFVSLLIVLLQFKGIGIE